MVRRAFKMARRHSVMKGEAERETLSGNLIETLGMRKRDDSYLKRVSDVII